MIIAGLARDLPIHQVSRCLEVEHENLRFKQTRVDPPAQARRFALEQRHHDGQREKITRRRIRNGDADTHGPMLGFSGDAHQTRHGLNNRINSRTQAIRSGLAESADAPVDKSGVDLLDMFPRYF